MNAILVAVRLEPRMGRARFPLSLPNASILSKNCLEKFRGSNRHLSRLVEINHVADIRYAGRKTRNTKDSGFNNKISISSLHL